MTPQPRGGRVLTWSAAVAAGLALPLLVVVGGLPAVVAAVRVGWPLLAGLAVAVAVHALLLRATRRRHDAEHRRFTVVDAAGRSIRCVLRGTPVGGRIERGDVVDVFGRRGRNGAVLVAEVVVAVRSERVHGRLPAGHVLVRTAPAVRAAAAAVLLIGVTAVLILR